VLDSDAAVPEWSVNRKLLAHTSKSPTRQQAEASNETLLSLKAIVAAQSTADRCNRELLDNGSC